MNVPPTAPGYRLLSQLGAGGTANVYKAFSDKLHTNVALKCRRPDQTDEAIDFDRLIEREKQLIGGLSFPGIVRILDSSVANDCVSYLALELCDGMTLDQIGKLDDVGLALNVLSAIAIDLEFLRALKIVHGDLKPQNIFLPSDWSEVLKNSHYYLKLADFSLGKLTHESSADRAGLGTVGYMPPETILDSKTDARSDLFALGVIAYQMLSGEHPFLRASTDPVRVHSMICEQDPSPLSSIRPDLTDGICRLIAKLMSRAPIKRPESGWEVCRELKTLGAAYPFEKVLRPAHFIDKTRSFTDNLERTLRMTDRHSHRIRLIANGDTDKLRLVLTANFIRENLTYRQGRFEFNGEIYWPSLLRRRQLRSFTTASMTDKKEFVKAAIRGESGPGTIRQKNTDSDHDRNALAHLLQPMIGGRTVRHLSLPYARTAEYGQSFQLAAQLYLQAGELDDSVRCAIAATPGALNPAKASTIFNLRRRIVNYAAMTDREPAARSLIMACADSLKDRGESEQAESWYYRLIAASVGLPHDGLLAETYKDLGDLYKTKQDFKSGIKALEKALAIYRELNDRLEISHTLNNIGNIYWVASELDKALFHYRQALSIQRQLDSHADIASTLNNIGSVYGVRGRFDRAGRLLNLSLQIKKELGDAGEIARTLNNLGYCHQFTGQTGKAVDCLTESLRLNRQIGSNKEILFNLENLTAVMITAGRLKESLSFLKEGSNLADSLGDKQHSGAFKVSMSIVYRRIGRIGEAARLLDEATPIAEELDDWALRAMLSNSRANLRFFLNDRGRAMELALDAFKGAEKINDSAAQLNALLLISRIQPRSDYAERAAALIEQGHLNRERTLLCFNEIEGLLTRKRIDEATELARRHLEKLSQFDEDIELSRLYNIAAELMIENNRPDDAETYLVKSTRLARTVGLPPELMQALTLRGRIDLDRKEFEACFQGYRRALEIGKQISAGIECPQDREQYQRLPSIKFLMEEIRRLSELLGQRKRAGENTCPRQ